jgi:hypothetical protein
LAITFLNFPETGFLEYAQMDFVVGISLEKNSCPGWLALCHNRYFSGYSLFIKNPSGIMLLVTLVPLVLISGFLYPFFLYRKLQKEEKAKEPEL